MAPLGGAQFVDRDARAGHDCRACLACFREDGAWCGRSTRSPSPFSCKERLSPHLFVCQLDQMICTGPTQTDVQSLNRPTHFRPAKIPPSRRETPTAAILDIARKLGIAKN